MRVLTVLGNRPQSVKAAAVSRVLRARHEEVLVHTGQHFDDELSTIFERELGVPKPEIQLGLGGGTNTEQTAKQLAALGPLVAEQAPDVVLVYGDTNSTLTGGIAAAQAGIPVAHVEAGMRSWDWAMPEEQNRVLTDALSDLLLCPSHTAVENLEREHPRGSIVYVGDVMVDVADLFRPKARERTEVLERFSVEPGGFVVCTTHRAANVDDPERLRALVDLLLAVPYPVVLPLHPRTRARLEAAGLLETLARKVTLAPPLGYLDFTALLVHAHAALTDSGGVQKEAFLARTRCVTMRDTTEWVETVESGWNVLVDLDAERAVAELDRPLPAEHPQPYGDGHAAEKVVDALEEAFASSPSAAAPA
ncbi:MAG TPA: UDP-N-acetylglucosamine 2-epimerase (non-hydrolyzing) [Capillimicrobium sp.]|nr:UDP-N-acetylglucosamine 2-epimerase (non-hydrolyzing) [Capillimicrobium sp.]